MGWGIGSLNMRARSRASSTHLSCHKRSWIRGFSRMPTRRDVAAYCDASGGNLGAGNNRAAKQIAELNADLFPLRSVPVERKRCLSPILQRAALLKASVRIYG